MTNSINTGTSYFGSRILRHVKADMRKLKYQGFNFVIHTFSEYDYTYHRGNIADIVDVTHESGLKVYLDPWGVGNVFGGEPFSDFVTEHFQDSCQLLDNGQRVHLACPNAPEFQRFMQDWLTVAITTDADGILWDEPHFHSPSHLKGQSGRWGCRCEHCQKIFMTKNAKPLSQIEDDQVRAFKIESLVAFLESLSVRSSAAGLQNILFLTADQPAETVYRDWQHYTKIRSLDVISTGPYWMWAGLPLESVRDYALILKRIATENSKDHLFWIQCCKIKAERNAEIRQAIEMAHQSGMCNFALWGFEGCAAESWIACDNPAQAWRTAISAFNSLKHKLT